tara:strand:+ start:2746 stop:3600 length:855 start_codon:yes stop_codon:yes gene_type:complete
MAPKKEGSINEETMSDAIRYKSDLEDIDFALFKFVDEQMNVSTSTNKGFEKVPVIWSGAERAYNVKDDTLDRDKIGYLTLPAITVERTAVKKTNKSRVIPYAMIDPVGDLKGGALVINRVINQDKTSNFANADAKRLYGQKNFPMHRKKGNKKIVYETHTIPIPIYVEVVYKIYLRSEYQEQMNDMLTPFIRSSNAHKRIIISHNMNEYEAFFDEDYTIENNISNYESNERKYETSIGLNVYGYLIGDGKNQKQPRVVRNENAVQIRFARERIVVQDEDGEFRF